MLQILQLENGTFPICLFDNHIVEKFGSKSHCKLVSISQILQLENFTSYLIFIVGKVWEYIWSYPCLDIVNIATRKFDSEIPSRKSQPLSEFHMENASNF